MKVSLLIRKNLLEEDYDVSDGDSSRAEFKVSKIRSSVISKKPTEILIEFIGEEDKTVLSIIMTPNEYSELNNSIVASVIES